MSIDRRSVIQGLYAITPDSPDTTWLQSRVQQAIDGGLHLLQYRSKSLPPSVRAAQAHALARQCAAQGVHLIINDDPALALACGAFGVHLGKDDEIPPGINLGDSKHPLLKGVSCYDSLQRALDAEAAGADYVAFGSVFPSPTKPGAVAASLDLFREARRRLGIPVVAIGGITLAHTETLIAAGAHSVAVLSALFGAADIAATVGQFNVIFEGHHEQS